MTEQKIKIFLADDHHVFRESIRVLLESQAPIEVVGEAATGRELLEKLPQLQADIVLLDIDMPDVSGLELMKEFSKQYSNIPVLVLSSHDDEQFIDHMLTNGAKGYILKNCRKDELIMAIKTVSAGGNYLGQATSKKIFDAYQKNKAYKKKLLVNPLTKREIEILKLVAKGFTNQEIGKQLFISHRTVDTHRRNMMTKLDLHSAVALTNYAAEQGLLTDT